MLSGPGKVRVLHWLEGEGSNRLYVLQGVESKVLKKTQLAFHRGARASESFLLANIVHYNLIDLIEKRGRSTVQNIDGDHLHRPKKKASVCGTFIAANNLSLRVRQNPRSLHDSITDSQYFYRRLITPVASSASGASALTLYALRVLLAYGMNGAASHLQISHRIAKLLYASSAWCGFTKVDRQRGDAFLLLPPTQQAMWLLPAKPAPFWRAVQEV